MLDDRQQRGRLDLVVAELGATDVQRAEASLVMGRDRHRLQDSLDLFLVEPFLAQAVTRTGRHQLLGARTGGHSLRGNADQTPRPHLRGHGRAVQRVQLLGLDSRDRCRLMLGKPGLHADLGPPGALARAHEPGNVLGERLHLERRLV